MYGRDVSRRIRSSISRECAGGDVHVTPTFGHSARVRINSSVQWPMRVEQADPEIARQCIQLAQQRAEGRRIRRQRPGASENFSATRWRGGAAGAGPAIIVESCEIRFSSFTPSRAAPWPRPRCPPGAAAMRAAHAGMMQKLHGWLQPRDLHVGEMRGVSRKRGVETSGMKVGRPLFPGAGCRRLDRRSCFRRSRVACCVLRVACCVLRVA